MQHHHLVEMRFPVGRDRRSLIRRKDLRALPQIDDDDLVAEAVHFDEREGRGGVHGALYGEKRSN